MDCCGQCVKYSMFVANFVIFVSIDVWLDRIKKSAQQLIILVH